MRDWTTALKRSSARHGVQVGIPVALLASIVLGCTLPHSGPLPSTALGTTFLFFGERAIAIFFGFLLLFVPFVRALRGQLPIELSFQGAKYAEEAGATAEALEDLDRRVETSKLVLDALASHLQATVERVAALEDESRRGRS